MTRIAAARTALRPTRSPTSSASMMPAGVPPIGLFRTFVQEPADDRGRCSRWGTYELGRELSASRCATARSSSTALRPLRVRVRVGRPRRVLRRAAGLDAAQVASLTHGSAADPCWTDERDRLLIDAVDELHDRVRRSTTTLGARSPRHSTTPSCSTSCCSAGWYHAISYAARTPPVSSSSRAPPLRRRQSTAGRSSSASRAGSLMTLMRDDLPAGDGERHDRDRPAAGRDDDAGRAVDQHRADASRAGRANMSARPATASAPLHARSDGPSRRRRRAARRRGRARRPAPRSRRRGRRRGRRRPPRAGGARSGPASAARPAPGAGRGWRAGGSPPASGRRSAAMSSKGTANMSCSTKASRSAGASVSSTTSSASPTESASSASCSGSMPSSGLTIGSGTCAVERLLAAASGGSAACRGTPGRRRSSASRRGSRCSSASARLEPQPRLLHGVVGLGERAEHPVGHGPQVGPVLLEPLGQPNVSSSILSHLLRAGGVNRDDRTNARPM